MSTENQNSAGTTSALAQKTGIKPLAKIIAGVCAAIVVLVAFCSVFGDPTGVAAVKNSVWNYDETVTFEEAVNAYCEKKTRNDKEEIVAVWEEGEVTSTGLRKVKLTFMQKGEEKFTLNFLIYPDGSIRPADGRCTYNMQYRIYAGSLL